MALHFTFFNVLILAGCVQGIILGLLLFINQVKSYPHLLLGVLLVTYSLNNLNAVFFDTKLSLQVPALLICPFSLIMAIGPALYLHTAFTLRPAKRFRRVYLLHFVPAMAELLWYSSLSLIFWGNPAGVRNFYHRYETWYSLPEQLGGILSVFIYLLLTLRMLKRHKQQLKNIFSAIEGLTYRRLTMLVSFLGLGWLTWLLLIIIDVTYFDFSLDQYVYYPLYVVMSVTIYAIGYSGYFRKVIVIEYPAPEIVKNAAVTPLQVQPNAELEDIAVRLQSLMAGEKLYLDPSLRLKTVADAIPCTQQKLSTALNGVLKKNFYDFVNEYRVKAVEEKLADPAFNQLTLTALAYDCGFNAKSTFNDIFKKTTGKTPKEYKNWVQNDVRLVQADVSPVVGA